MRKRSNYRPKPIRLDNMSWVRAGLKKLTELTDENAVVRVKNHGALRAMVTGTGTKDDADVLIAALNMTEALARMRIGKDWAVEIRAGQNALLSVCRSHAKHQRFVLTEQELEAINLAMDVHDAQLDKCTVQELERALEIVRRIKVNGCAIQIEETI